jgi:hypothetical protein
MLVVLALAVIASIGVSLAGSARANTAGTPLRQVDWLSVLSNDPAVTVDPTAVRPPGAVEPYVRVAAPGSQAGTLAGYAMIDDVAYGDLDGDGAEEAVLPVFSGGTAGTIGFLLYGEGSPDPRLVLVETGYKLGLVIDGGSLVIYRPNYVGFEANCCPSSSTRTVNVLEGDQLVALATDVRPNDVQEPTVWAFYQALSNRRYEDAYAFYSPALQASNPFDQWKAGYAATQSIEVQTSPGPTPSEVLIDLTATDARPDGGTVRRRFRGAWTLIWSAEQKRWLLDQARIEPAE